MTFWIVAGAICLGVTGLLIGALLRRGPAGAAPAAYDLRVYRDQLGEIERDVARGVIPQSEAERLRVEVSRRVLDADRAMAAATGEVAAPRGATLAMAGLVTIAMLGGVWAYLRLGAPGYPDMPMEARIAMAEALHRDRPSQAEAEAAAPAPAPVAAEPDFLDLMDKLRTALATRPDDLQGHQLLARNEAGLGNYGAAIAAQRVVVALKGAEASGEDHAALAEMMILAAGGYVSPEAEAELTAALQRDPLNGTAIYYAGLMSAQLGRPDRTFSLWAPLLDRSAPTDPWVAPIRAQIERIAAEAGENRYVLPPDAGAPGPTAADMQAAQDMTPEERQAMIQSMVAQLGERLATEGGPAEDWARLIGAYGVLGEGDRARAIWTEAQTRFAGRDADLAIVRAAAEQAGVAE
jgi:cytochrome c-type biogenesis protein CcmH